MGRRFATRRLPRWRAPRTRDALEVALSLPDLPDEGPAAALLALVGVVVVGVVLIPLLLFGIELIALGLVVAAGILARALLGRPWIVQAGPSTGKPQLAWRVWGWRRSGRVIEEVAGALAAGLDPAPRGVDDGHALPVRDVDGT